MKTIADLAAELSALKMQQVNYAFVEQVTKIEGQTPSLQDVSHLGSRFVFPDGSEEYRWRGKTVLKVAPFDGQRWTVTKV